MFSLDILEFTLMGSLLTQKKEKNPQHHWDLVETGIHCRKIFLNAGAWLGILDWLGIDITLDLLLIIAKLCISEEVKLNMGSEKIA